MSFLRNNNNNVNNKVLIVAVLVVALVQVVMMVREKSCTLELKGVPIRQEKLRQPQPQLRQHSYDDETKEAVSSFPMGGVSPEMVSNGVADTLLVHADYQVQQSLKEQHGKDRIMCSFFHKHRFVEAFPKPCQGCTSQGAQDHILQWIFNTIGTTNRHCVEFGFGYAKVKQSAAVESLTLQDFKLGQKLTNIPELNTHALIAQGWTPTFFDAEFEFPNINVVKTVLTGDNIVDVFKQNNIMPEVDYVSIDVDSVDLWLLEGLLRDGTYQPRVISVEYNNGFPVDSLVACERKWAPWKHGSRVYGASAGAINFVAEMYGYKVVEVMPIMDLFLVRKDILEERCLPESLPDFETLAEPFVGKAYHKKCKASALARLVDVPLSLQGKEVEAKERAMAEVRRVNQIYKQKWGQPFCELQNE